MTDDRVGPLLTAEELTLIRRWLEHGSPMSPGGRILAHIDAQDATIANQNREMDRLNGEVRRLAGANERLAAEVRRVLRFSRARTGRQYIVPRGSGIRPSEVPLIDEILQRAGGRAT